MITQALGISDSPLLTFVFLVASSYAFFLLLATAHYLLLFRRRRQDPAYRVDRGEIRRGIVWSFLSLSGNAVVTAPIHVAIATGHSRVYWDVADMGWGYLVGSVVALFVFTETLVYWAHRALHVGPLYRKLHRIHHSFHQPTPYTGVAFHPADSLMQALPYHVFAFIVPVHATVYMVALMMVSIWAVVIHSRTSSVTWGAINYTAHHDIHHWYYDFNYGQYTTLWDRMMGTYRSPAKLWPPKESPEVARRTYDPMVTEADATVGATIAMPPPRPVPQPVVVEAALTRAA